MAQGAVIGALRVVLGADSATLTSDLDRARGEFGKFGADIAKAGAAIGIAIAAAYGAVSIGVANTLKSMDELGKSSQKIGIPVEQLSGLKLAAEVSGASLESLQTGMGKLSKAMVEAAAKPTSEAANAFKALGVSVTDSNGKLRPVLDVTESMADKFAGLKDGAGKTAVSLALLGRGGAELIPMLNMGSQGIQGMIAAAQKFGIVIDGPTAAAATKFNDTLKMLGAAKDGLIVKLTAFLLPALQQFADRMLANASNSEKQTQKLDILKGAFDVFARAVLVLVDNFGALLKIGAVFIGASIANAALGMIIAFVNLARAVQAAGLMMAAFEAIRAIGTKGILVMVGLIALATGQFENLKNAIGDIASKISSALPEGATKVFSDTVKALGFDLTALSADLTNLGHSTEGANKGQKDLNYSILGGKTAVDNFLDTTRKQIATQQAEIQTAGLAAGAKERLKVTLDAFTIAAQNSLPITDQMRQKISETAAAAENMALKLAGTQLIQQNLSPLQMYTQELKNSTTAMIAAGASQEQLARNAQNVADKFGTSASAIGTSIAGTMGQLSSLTGTFAKENKTMGIASKAFGIAQAIINTQIAVTKALATLPPPASYAAVALAIATGAASVATIASQKFALGGSFTVPGGVSMTDNTFVPLNLAAGERVSIQSNRYGQDGVGSGGSNNGGGSPTPVVVHIAGRSDRDWFAQQIAGINAAIADGYRLQVA